MNELYHYGIKGMKWGVRRYQNKDGSLTDKGKKRYSNNNDAVNNDNEKTRRDKLKKAALIVGGAAVIAVGTYYTKKYIDMNGDKVLKSGTDIQHMARSVEEYLHRPFYASHLKGDNKEYGKADFFGASHWKYKKTLTSSKDIKIAGTKTALDTFSEWVMSDPKAKKKFEGLDVKNRKQLKRAYDSFNRNFISPDMWDRELRDSYFSRLQEKGYGAVRDRNDQKYSGMRSPIMIFGSLADLTVKEIQQVNIK